MIQLIAQGAYTLTGTRHGARLLQLQRRVYAWIVVPRIGALLVRSAVPHVRREILNAGTYRLYDVVDEPRLSDQLHLELALGKGQWQGYLLPMGLPDRQHIRRRIIPTHEVISQARVLHRVKSHGPAFVKPQRV